MAVQLVVHQYGGGNIVVNLPPSRELGEGVTENVERATAAALFGCVSSAAASDDRLTPEEVQNLQFQPQPTGPDEEVDAAIEFGRSARLFGDNIDRLVQGFRNQSQTRDFVDGCVKESDPGQATSTALQSFIEVARLVFEVDEGGLGHGFSYGRLAVLLYLGYDVCVAFLKQHSMQALVQFMSKLVNRLITFLAGAGFFGWLLENGGWTKILALATKNRYILGLIHGAVIGVSAVVVIYLLKNRFWK